MQRIHHSILLLLVWRFCSRLLLRFNQLNNFSKRQRMILILSAVNIKKTFRIIIFLMIFGVSAQFAYSCSCFRIENEAEIEITDFIFVGKVVEIIEDQSYVPPKVESAPGFVRIMNDTRKRYLIKFKVKMKFKGVEDDEITLVKYVQDSMCLDTSFEREKTYLIYADKGKDSEEIKDNGICSRTQKFGKTSKDYKELLNLKKGNRVEQKKLKEN